MIRQAPRALRNLAPTRSSILPLRLSPQIRRASTVPRASRPRSWQSSGLRWGIAIAGLYWYNTSDWFRAETENYKHLLEHQVEDDILPNIEALAARRKEERQQLALAATSSSSSASFALNQSPTTPSTLTSTSAIAASPASSASSTSLHNSIAPAEAGNDATAAPTSALESLEEEAGNEGAYNEETGEINWDCSCLGGMAYGPCGPQFREAFSCFIYSKEEPKGVDCIDRFKNMQDCFRLHPDIYGSELSDDPEDDEEYQASLDAPSQPAQALSSEPSNRTEDIPAHATSGTTSKQHQPEVPSKSVAPISSASSSASSPSSTTSTPTAPQASSITDTISSAAHNAASTLSSTISSASNSLSHVGETLSSTTDDLVSRVKAATEQVRSDHGGDDDAALKERSESDEVVPRAWYDGTVGGTVGGDEKGGGETKEAK